ncbi:hypothetical protein [Alkalihalobacillus sp. CinArs1]|uniref:hypothetical protein n=1 Tax=Alkalihalobacillus sp. CinArs1 TaxID=2995314 RepID=UPI0022DDA2A4|nr:hypothetical protein [Alkalihalobacillus sp. CinArs1]
MKQLSILLVLVLSMTLPVLTGASSIQYGAGEWDDKGTDTFKTKSKVIYSGGGNFKACMIGGSGVHEVTLWEADSNPDDKLAYGLLSPGTCKVWYGLSDEIDGKNNKAELYLTKSGGNAITVEFED